MPIVNAKDLLAAGSHFGHSSSRWNPKMAPYLLGKRNKIHIINLRETVKGVVAAYYMVRKLVAQGELVLFIGAKRQAMEIVATHGRRCGMPYVAERWLGGTLTNLQTIHTRVRRLIELEHMDSDGSITTYNKKMQSAFNREKRKLLRNLDGIRTLDRLPAALVVVDPKHEATAVREARRMGILVIAQLDTDADPDEVDLPIPANDDAIRSIDLIVGKLADAALEGANYRREHPELARQAQESRYRRQVENREAVAPAASTDGSK
jgi:small subunit ribosomal protein S2